MSLVIKKAATDSPVLNIINMPEVSKADRNIRTGVFTRTYKKKYAEVIFVVNEKITHILFGRGTVVSHSDNYITVSFEEKKHGEKIFVFPGGFEHFLTFENSGLQEKTLEDIRRRQQKALEIKKSDEAAEKKHLDAIAEARLGFVKKTPRSKLSADKKPRIVKVKKTADITH